MRLFGRKKKFEEEDDDGPRRKILAKEEPRELTDKEKFFREERKKDRTKQKPFEVKPWTKKERYFVLTVFLSTILASGVLAGSAREWKLPNMPRIGMPKILSGETFVIEGNKDTVDKSSVIKTFDDLTEPLSGVYGFFVLKLEDGTSYGVNHTEVFDAGSLNKLPVMLTMYKEAEEGSINLSQKYILKGSDKVEGNGNVTNAPEGTEFTYEELIEAMGQQSDNTAFVVAKKILGEEKILKVMDEVGLSRSLLTDNQITPQEIGRFFKTLMDAQVVSAKTRDILLGYMTNTIYENWIARDVPVKVSHKYGTLTHVRNDAGVVFATKPYILVVMSKGIVEKEADEVIPKFSLELYNITSAN